MSGQRQVQRLAQVAQRLSPRDQQVLGDVVRLRVLSAGHISRLHFHAIERPMTRIRRVQRQTARMVELGLLRRLAGRRGGVRAGSRGTLFIATTEGRRLAAHLAGEPIPRLRSLHLPGERTIAHTLAGNDLFVALVEAARADTRLEVLEHQSEPTCWRAFLGPLAARQLLKPDAFVAVGNGPLEHRALVEIDLDSEGTTTLRRKLQAHVAYWRSGAEHRAHGVAPRVVWVVPDRPRAEVLTTLIEELPPPARPLFTVATPDRAVDVLIGGAS